MKIIDLSRGVPDPQSFPADKLQALTVSALARDANRMLQYGSAFGYMPLREFIASWFDCAAPNVLVGNGSLEIFSFLCEAYLKPGDVVFVERPTYDRALTTLKQHGVTIVGIDVHEDGICLDVLERELQRHTPKLVYLIPDFQNPTGVSMTLDARRTMVRLARQHRFLIVEDGPYGFLRYSGEALPSILSMAPDITLHLSSFTKLISPGVRVGFLVAPAEVAQRVARVAERHYITPGVFAQGVVAAWCEDGQLPLQLDRLRRRYGPRLEVCVRAIERYLPGGLFVRPEGGFFTSVRLGAHIDESSLQAAAAQARLALSSGSAFFDAYPGYQFLRLPFCALAEADIVEGIQRLGDVVSHLNISARLAKRASQSDIGGTLC